MGRWWRRVRGAVGMGLTWAAAWALVGVLIGVASLVGIPMGWLVEVFDAPLPALAVPGVFAGAALSGVLGLAGRQRRFDELSPSRFGAWGVAGGLLLGRVPVVAARSTLTAGTVVVALGTLTLLSAASASASLALARMSEDQSMSSAGSSVSTTSPPSSVTK